MNVETAPPPADRTEDILSDEALAFVAELHGRFGQRRSELLEAREQRDPPSGFLDETLRQLDFDSGYDDTLRWLADGGLERHGLSEEVTAAAVETAREAYQPPSGGAARKVPPGARRDLARLLLRVTAVGGYDLVQQAARRRAERSQPAG